jgi:hypothetical protein
VDKSERDCIFELEIWVVAGTLPFRNYIDVNSGEFIPTSLRIIRIYGGEQANHHDNVILLTRYSLKKYLLGKIATLQSERGKNRKSREAITEASAGAGGEVKKTHYGMMSLLHYASISVPRLD